MLYLIENTNDGKMRERSIPLQNDLARSDSNSLVHTEQHQRPFIFRGIGCSQDQKNLLDFSTFHGRLRK